LQNSEVGGYESRKENGKMMRAKGGMGELRWTIQADLLALLATLFAASIMQAGCSGKEGEAAVHLDSAHHLTAEPDVRIGHFDDPDLGFSRVSGIDVDDDGNVYVLEGLVPEIRVFDPQGTLLRRIGRRGAGPGEFENPPRFGVIGDTVWTVDNQAKRITLFDREGTVLSTGRQEDVLVPLPSGFGYVLPWLMRPDGKFTSHFARIGYSRDDPGTDVKPTDSIPVPFVLFNASGVVTDTIGWADRPPPRMWRPPSQAGPPPNIIDVGGRRVFVPTPPTPLPSWLPEEDGYVLVETPLPEDGADGVLRITQKDTRGDTVYHDVFHYSPSRYSSEDLDSIAVWAARGDPRGMAPYVPGSGPPSDWRVVANHLREAMDFPDFRLPIDSAWLAQDGGLWLRLAVEAGSETAGWILLDSQGHIRGRLDLPTNLRVRWSRGDLFWAVEPDEYDVPWVVRFRINSAGPS
jgi:hypothetical protein